ncbi:Crp/Fnr family transcriptional regulator [Isoptericola halotolerans]|uniref:Crp/Fnr family transcriptional regulator n=1 Tax=Isoptericola halotolerans TaxID=300560 RepID=UPI003890025B
MAATPPDDLYCLAEVDLFRDLSRHEMAELNARAPLRTVDAGQIVFDPLRPVEVLFIVKRGRLRVFRVLADGKTVTTAVLGPGTVVGEMPPLGLRMRGAWAEALEPSELCLMSRTDVRDMLFTQPRVALRIAELLSTRLADLEDQVADLTTKTLTERLAATLCRLARHAPDQPVRLTHAQLAALVGATRERTTTALGELADQGCINLKRGRIHLTNTTLLDTIANSER